MLDELHLKYEDDREVEKASLLVRAMLRRT